MAVTSLTDATFAQALQDHERVFVKYHADWCGSCKLIAPKFKRMADRPDFAGVLFAEVDAERNPEARAAAGVNTLPYFAIFTRGQRTAADSSSKEEFIAGMLEKALGSETA